MTYFSSDYEDVRRRRNRGIAMLGMVAVIIVLLSYSLSRRPSELTGGESGGDPQSHTDVKGDIPTLVARTGQSVVLIKTFDREDQEVGQGTGFFVAFKSGETHVVSNRHVFKGAHRAEVHSKSGTYPIKKVLEENDNFDLVRLEIDTRGARIPPLAISKIMPRVGESVLVIGNPFGLKSTVSDGIVSAVRSLDPHGTVIQMTTPISPGSSGSPVLNMEGQVIGVATFQMRGGQNLNFAIPIDRIDSLKPVKGQNLAGISYEADSLLDSLEDPFDKGMVLYDRKEYAGAVYFFREAVKNDPGNAEAHYCLGICYRETGSTDAIDALKRAVAADPGYGQAFCQMGITYYRLNMQTEAIQAFREALRINPDDDEALLNLGVVYAMGKKYKSAVSVLEQAVEIFPHLKAHYYLGVCYNQLNKFGKAIDSFKAAIEIDLEYVDAYLGLATAFGAVKNWRRGIRTLNKVVILAPQNPQVHYLLGLLHLGNQDLPSAQLEYEILGKLSDKEARKLSGELSNSIYKYKTSQRRW